MLPTLQPYCLLLLQTGGVVDQGKGSRTADTQDRRELYLQKVGVGMERNVFL